MDHAILLLVVLLTTLLIVLPAHALAPSATPLVVRVIDDSSGRPLPDATVLLDGGWRVRPAGADGRVAFPDLPPGSYELTARHLGFVTVTRTVVVQPGVPRHILLALVSTPLRADTVAFTVAAPSGGYHLSETELRIRAGESVGEALRQIPGVQVHQAGGAGSRATVSLRGARPEQVRVEVDGVPLNDGSGNAPDLGTVPLMGVRSIEVDPGVAPGAPGGAIRIHTRADGTPGMFWSTGVVGESAQTWEGSAAIRSVQAGRTFQLHARALRTAGTFQYTDETGREQSRINNDRERLALALRGGMPTSLGRIEGGVSVDALDAGSPSPLYQPPTPEARSTERGWRGHLVLRPGTSITGTRVRLTGAGTARTYGNPSWQTDPRTGERIRHIPSDVEDEDVRGSLRISHTQDGLRMGASRIRLDSAMDLMLERFVSHDHLANGATPDRISGTVHRAQLGGELRSEVTGDYAGWTVRGRFHGRLDQVRDAVGSLATPFSAGAGTHPSGRVTAAAHAPGDRWTLDVAAGSAVHLPAFTHRFLTETVFALGNPALRPETVRELEGGVAWTQPLPSGRRLHATARGFLRTTDDLIVWRRNWRGQFFPDNLAQATARGVELAGTVSGDGLWRELRGAFTVQRVVNTTPGAIWEGRRIPFQPDLYGHLSAHLAPHPQLALLGEVQLAGRRYTTESNLDPVNLAGGGLAPYATLDVQVRWTRPLGQSGVVLAITAEVDNVTDTRYALLDRMPMPGRIWHGGLRFHPRS